MMHFTLVSATEKRKAAHAQSASRRHPVHTRLTPESARSRPPPGTVIPGSRMWRPSWPRSASSLRCRRSRLPYTMKLKEEASGLCSTFIIAKSRNPSRWKNFEEQEQIRARDKKKLPVKTFSPSLPTCLDHVASIRLAGYDLDLESS